MVGAEIDVPENASGIWLGGECGKTFCYGNEGLTVLLTDGLEFRICKGKWESKWREVVCIFVNSYSS
jgi:hypothetical protein